MRLFISAGEPSGDLHGANLARALRALDPRSELQGLGGPRMHSAGVELLYPLAEHAVMGLIGVFRFVPSLVDLLERVQSEWQRRRPDAVVLIDYPGYHWWVAARARAMGIPVVSFVPPQIWAWASWRVSRIRQNFDHVLCSLPFEESWFHARGVPQARYVGHPYFDELAHQQLDQRFMAEQRSGGPLVTLLPGSRGHEVNDNLDSLFGAARRIQHRRPDVRFLFACYREQHRQRIAARIQRECLPATAVTGHTGDAIASGDACIAVSGSVGLELMYRRKPTVIIYRTSSFHMMLVRLLKNVDYISIVNLLAGRQLFPEYLSSRAEVDGPADHVLNWLNEVGARQAVVAELGKLCDRIARPGACRSAAEFLLDRFGSLVRRAA